MMCLVDRRRQNRGRTYLVIAQCFIIVVIAFDSLRIRSAPLMPAQATGRTWRSEVFLTVLLFIAASAAAIWTRRAQAATTSLRWLDASVLAVALATAGHGFLALEGPGVDEDVARWIPFLANLLTTISGVFLYLGARGASVNSGRSTPPS